MVGHFLLTPSQHVRIMLNITTPALKERNKDDKKLLFASSRQQSDGNWQYTQHDEVLRQETNNCSCIRDGMCDIVEKARVVTSYIFPAFDTEYFSKHVAS